MELLITLRPKDVDAEAPHFDLDSFTPRSAGRAVIFDGGKVALLHIVAHDYYMLPGGGIEDESIQEGLKREIFEEVGCRAEIIAEIGRTVVYFDRWNRRQTDHCFTVKKIDTNGGAEPTSFEQEEGHKVIWTDSLEAAIKLMSEANPKNRDGKLVRARDLLFLQTVLKINH